jgi:hypothetical protein
MYRVIRRLTRLALVLIAGAGLSLHPPAASEGGPRVCVGLTGMVACVPPE